MKKMVSFLVMAFMVLQTALITVSAEEMMTWDPIDSTYWTAYASPHATGYDPTPEPKQMLLDGAGWLSASSQDIGTYAMIDMGYSYPVNGVYFKFGAGYQPEGFEICVSDNKEALAAYDSELWTVVGEHTAEDLEESESVWEFFYPYMESTQARYVMLRITEATERQLNIINAIVYCDANVAVNDTTVISENGVKYNPGYGSMDKTGWTAVASGEYYPDGPANLIDNSMDTRWAVDYSSSSNAWFMINVGLSKINKITVTDSKIDGSGAAIPLTADVYVSTEETAWYNSDDSSWKKVGTLSRGRVMTLDFPETDARYVMVKDNSNSISWWNVREVYLSGTKAVTADQTLWTANASTAKGNKAQGSFLPEQAVLGANRDGAWVCDEQVNGTWFIVDMAEVLKVNGISMQFESGMTPGTFELCYATDESVWNNSESDKWTTIGSYANVPANFTAVFDEVEARYFMMRITETNNQSITLYSFNAYCDTQKYNNVYYGGLSKVGWSVKGSNTYDAFWVKEKIIDNKFLSDNDRCSLYEYDATGLWCMIDMGEMKTFDRISLIYPAIAKVGHREGKVSAYIADSENAWNNKDDASWELISELPMTPIMNFDTGLTQARYIMIKADDKTTWLDIYELFVYNTAEAEPYAVTKLDNSGYKATVFASYENWWTGDKMFDGKYGETNRWSSGQLVTKGQNIVVDMGKETEIAAVVMDSNHLVVDGLDGHIGGYKVSLSTDGVEYNDVYEGTGERTSVASFAPQTARFIKVEITEDREAWWNIHEFYVCAPMALKDATIDSENSVMNVNIYAAADGVIAPDMFVAIYEGEKLVNIVKSDVKTLEKGINSIPVSYEVNSGEEAVGFVWNNYSPLCSAVK